MPSRPIEAHHKNAARSHLPHAHPRTTGQHGKTHSLSHGESILLRFPSESLTHITSFLDPDTLLSLSGTNRQLHAHVKDDNTWRRAYVYHFLGISPESDLRDNGERKSLMLRREESTWRREFLLRYNLRRLSLRHVANSRCRRWERSRNQPVTHVPHHSSVVSMHLMPNTTLLTASLQYGIVARSYPLTGKVLRGYLDASGAGNGLGHGNPNLEFSPHVTAIALASEGRTAKVLWGFRNGEVAVTTAVRAMDGNRPSAAKHARCKAEECHEAAVQALAWGTEVGQEGPAAFATGDAHGQVKLWDAKRMKCLWTSIKKEGLERDVCAKIAFDVARGVVVAAMESNRIHVWSGLYPVITGEQVDIGPNEITIPPFAAFGLAQTPASIVPSRELLDLHVSIVGDSKLRVLIAYKHDSYLYRIDVDLATSDTERSAFGDGSVGAVTVVKPVFATQGGESNFVLVGDQLGGISIFDCDAPSPVGNTSVIPLRKIDAHEDGAVTALAWNTIVLASGSSRGTVKAWDSLTLAHLRTFPSPGTRPAAGGEWDGVNQILLERTELLASVGSRVMTWQAGPVGKHDKAKGKQVRAIRNSGGLAKWQQQVEMYRDIAESRHDLDEEQSHTRRVFGREREQQSTLTHLGLNEVEAVEYVLMLSRDEEENRRLQRALATPEDDGVFMADFDDLQTPVSGPSVFIEHTPSPAMSSPTSSFSSRSYSNGSVVINGRSLPRTVPSQSNYKIQVSPRMRPEPMEAGFASSPLNGSLSSSLNTQTSNSVPSTTDLDHFPPVSRTPSSTSVSVPSAPASPSALRRSGPGSPQSLRNAWATPINSRQSSSSTPASATSSPLLAPRRSSPPTRTSSTGPSLISAGFARQTSRSSGSPEFAPLTEQTEKEDEDLRLAIELSLAEARSRGENV
ncbi:hypothetical protein DAEQUDRAFT_375983 [Daedalea quercina L-15889]|uniref:F-box domain-containing protein n=1 Tax=Daedalea quercina L-15889 TaxID=1314783 RepID=A0A165P880_9APHY|nr:hypothetical protein DAEQUDRAFT_375983 [Daedalea quercina L-15889]